MRISQLPGFHEPEIESLNTPNNALNAFLSVSSFCTGVEEKEAQTTKLEHTQSPRLEYKHLGSHCTH